MSKGFAFPRRFKSAATLLPTLTRNNRELTNFLNSFVVRFDGDKLTLTLPGNLTVAGDISTDGFTAPSLLNSWVNFGSGNRSVGYKQTSDGTVHIRGLVKDGTSATAIIFTLPTALRPTEQIHFAGTSNDAHFTLKIGADGSVFAGGGSPATNWLSLDVSFQTS